VAGLDQFSRDLWPPMEITFYSYHVMMLLGFYFIGVSLLGVFLLLRKRLFTSRWYLWIMLASLLLPLLALEFGWMAAEMGRQPWVVYGLLKTLNAASVVVPAGQILFTLILFAVVYSLLLALLAYLLKREIARGPQPVHVEVEAHKEVKR